jgi:hypothetical protein
MWMRLGSWIDLSRPDTAHDRTVDSGTTLPACCPMMAAAVDVVTGSRITSAIFADVNRRVIEIT